MMQVHPRLIVDDGDAAIDFYRTALGAEVLSRHTDAGGRVVNADLVIDGASVSVTEGDDAVNRSPSSLGGTPVILSATVGDVDAVAAAFTEAGGEVVFEVDDRPYGRRDGRFIDPSGHLWIFGMPLT